MRGPRRRRTESPPLPGGRLEPQCNGNATTSKMLAVEPNDPKSEYATAPIWGNALVRRRPWVRFPPWAPL
jgi:hypothetical protein